jgi:hypothetical protein
VGKRNQYNRSTLPQDMSIVVYNANATVVQSSGSLGAINVDAGLWFYGGASEATGTIDISAMRNGQSLVFVNGSDYGVLLNCSTGRVLSPTFTTASSTVLASKKTFVTYKLDSAPTDVGLVSDVLVLISSGTYPGFP